MRIILFFGLMLGLASTIYAQIEVNGKKLEKGGIHINSWEGLFASNLDGDFTIVMNVDYDERSMNATIINNATGDITCLPTACSYNN